MAKKMFRIISYENLHCKILLNYSSTGPPHRDQLAIVLPYLNEEGFIQDCFLRQKPSGGHTGKWSKNTEQTGNQYLDWTWAIPQRCH
jgi:hypothetical protein